MERYLINLSSSQVEVHSDPTLNVNGTSPPAIMLSTPVRKKRPIEDIVSPTGDESVKKVDDKETPVKTQGVSLYDEIKSDGAPAWFLKYVLRTNDQALELKKEVLDLKTETNKEIATLKETIEKQKTSISDLEQKVDDLDLYSRKSNLIIEGVSETPGEDIYKVVDTFFKKDLGVLDNIGISVAHRLGRAGREPRPIIVKFIALRERDIIWQNKYKLKKSAKVIKEHFTPKVQHARSELFPYFKIAQRSKSVKRCSMAKDRLVIDGKHYSSKEIKSLPNGIGTNMEHDNKNTYFFGKMSPLSNFHPANFNLDRVQYSNVEQYYQVARAEFYRDDRIAFQMMSSNDPRKIKALSHSVKTKEGERDWFSKKAKDVMTKAVRAKFSQNRELAKFLVNETKETLVECNPHDRYFSCGLGMSNVDRQVPSKWPGKNVLGDVLMYVKSELKQIATV